MGGKILIRRILIIFLLIIFPLASFPGCGGETTIDNNGEVNGPAPAPEESFSLDLAIELGRLCLQAYQMLIDFNDGKTFTLPPPFNLIEQFFTNESFTGQVLAQGSVPIAFIATRDENIYVVFRGTVTIAEWIIDAEYSQVPYSFLPEGGLTENGFTSVYKTLNEGITQKVNELIQTGNFTKLFVTGHSLGAGLAVLAAPELAVKTPFADLVMYNFAGPRVGDPDFAEFTYGAHVVTSFRVANTNDLVPTLPPIIAPAVINNQVVVFFYEHVEKENPITFGNPISGPFDFSDIEANHIMCNYFNAFCEMTDDVEACKNMADGADGCNT